MNIQGNITSGNVELLTAWRHGLMKALLTYLSRYLPEIKKKVH